ETEAIAATWIGRQKWLKKPFLRGSLALLDSMALGSRAMKFATSVQVDPQYGGEPLVVSKKSAHPTEAGGGDGAAAASNKKVQDMGVGGTMVFALVFGLFLFTYVPNAVAEFGLRKLGNTSSTQINLASEVIKIAIFLGYIGLIGTNKDIERVFQYHGAEHKA